MRNHFPGYYKPSAEEFAALWTEATFAFDANVLLDLYRSTPATQEAFLDVLVRLRSRLWLPGQAAEEFLRNRLEVISTLKGAYQKIDAISKDTAQRFETAISSYRKHPVLRVDDLQRLFQEATDAVCKITNEKVAYHPNYLETDPILDKVTRLFGSKTGEPLKPDKIEQLTRIGEQRYRKKIPPGYKDDGKDESHRYGDFVIWSELLEHGGDTKGIIFVTGDSKEDWWLVHEGKTIGPRPELIQEMYSVAKVPFYMYSPQQFIRWADVYIYPEDQTKDKDLHRAATELAEIAKQKELRSETSASGVPTAGLQSEATARFREALQALQDAVQTFTGILPSSAPANAATNRQSTPKQSSEAPADEREVQR